jgi:hypothetical protein
MYGCNKDNSKKEQIFPAIMKSNLNTFSFKDCCFLIQKDREGASRVSLHLTRSLSGKNSISLTASPFRSPSVEQTPGNTNLNISTSTIIEKWPKNFASRSSISQILNPPKYLRPSVTLSKTSSATTRMTTTAEAMTPTMKQSTKGRTDLATIKARKTSNQELAITSSSRRKTHPSIYRSKRRSDNELIV